MEIESYAVVAFYCGKKIINKKGYTLEEALKIAEIKKYRVYIFEVYTNNTCRKIMGLSYDKI